MNEKKDNNEFLSSISHEIRTALNTIVGLSDDINDYENIPEEIREDAEDLNAASKSLLELLDNVLDFIALENGTLKIVESHYNPKELFDDLSKKGEDRIGDKPIYFHSDVASDLPFELTGDKKYLKKIVNNLINNAIKYTEGGDIWYEVKWEKSGEDCNLIISVKDTGRGMKPEEMERVFERIESLNIEREKTGGTSLGLAITRRLIEMMKGSISIDSKYGEGSNFTLIIPQKIHLIEESDLSKTQRLRLNEINYEEEGYGYKKVLVVDDNTLNIKVVRRILEQFDLVLEECYNGQECIDKVIEDNDYDLILMDIMMPVLNGEETLKKLQEIDGFDTPVIALTAETDPGAQEKYESEGFAGYIAKPFSKTEIEEKIDKILKERELEEPEVHRKRNIEENYNFDGEFEQDEYW